MRLVGQAGLFEHDGDLDAVGSGQRVELQPVGMPGGPFAGDGKRREVDHVESCGEGCPNAYGKRKSIALGAVREPWNKGSQRIMSNEVKPANLGFSMPAEWAPH